MLKIHKNLKMTSLININTNMLILSPFEQFQILSLIDFQFFGFYFTITNALLINIIVPVCFSGIVYLFTSNKNYFKQAPFFSTQYKLLFFSLSLIFLLGTAFNYILNNNFVLIDFKDFFVWFFQLIIFLQ